MNKFTICSIIKNEALGLDEWIRHHLDLGFNHIYLFEDFDSISHAHITLNYKENVTLKRLCDIKEFKDHKGNPNRRIDLFNWFIRTQCDDIEWCAFIDIDEFIHLDIEQYHTLEYLFERYIGNMNSLALSQKFFDANNCTSNQKSCKESYTHQYDHNTIFKVITYCTNIYGVEEKTNEYFERMYKQFVHVSKVKNNETLFEDNINDFPNCGNVVVRKTYGNPDELNYNFEMIWIDHYYTKSLDDFIEKVRRGSIDKNNPINWLGFDVFFKINKSLEALDYFLIKQIKDNCDIPENTLLSEKYHLSMPYKINLSNKRKQLDIGKQAILFMCHKISYEAINRYMVIYDHIKNNDNYDLYWAFDGNELPQEYFDLKLNNHQTIFKFYIFSLDKLNDIYAKIGYSNNIITLDENTDEYNTYYGLPNCNLIVQDFLNNYEEYEYCWGIEYDVVHTSNWDEFWEQFEDNTNDYLASNITKFSWTHHPVLNDKNYVSLDDGTIYQALNCIFRISRRFSLFLDDFYKKNIGFFETTLPTLAIKYNYTLEDIGGDYEFTPKDKLNKNYITFSSLNNFGTLKTIRLTQSEYDYFFQHYPGVLLHECKLDEVKINVNQYKKYFAEFVKK